MTVLQQHFGRMLAVTCVWASILAFLAFAAAAPADAQRTLRLLRDQEIETALTAMSSRVFEQAGLSPAAVRFILIEDSNLNAFVAGGQNIFLHSGLILSTETPDELIGVIAHETGHIAGGHLFRTRETLEDLSTAALIAQIIGIAAAMGARSGETGVAIGSAGTTFLTRTMLRHSRIQESAADQSAVRYLQEAQLPVTGLLNFMRQLASQELLPESRQTQYVRTHPMTRDRIAFLENAEKSARKDAKVPPHWFDMHARMKAKTLGYLMPDRALRDLTGTSIAAQYGRAIATWRKGDAAAAMKTIDALIKKEPENPYFYELKGQILFENGRIADSLVPYERAVQLAPQSGLIRAAYGHALLEGKKPAAAARALNRALITEPHNARTHRLLAAAYGQTGDQGMSRLHLAEEALITGKLDHARIEAGHAQKHLKENTAGWLRAADIKDAIERRQRDEKQR